MPQKESSRTPTSRLGLRLLTSYYAAAVVLICHLVIGFTCVRDKCTTYDELAHMTAGYSYWKTGDYRLDPENGNFPQRWEALPLLALDLGFPPTNQTAYAGSNIWAMGYQFFYATGNNVDLMLRLSRAMVVLLSAALGLLVYAWSRRLFGPGGGMISLIGYAFNPSILANGSLATSDLAAALFFTASVGALWRLLHKVSPWTVICSALAMAGLFLSKMSAAMVIPMGLVLLIARLIVNRPLVVALGRPREVTRRLTQGWIFAGALIAHVLVVAGLIWTFYGFRYTAHREEAPWRQFGEPWDSTLDGTGGVGSVIQFAADYQLLPESYLFGTAFVYKRAQLRTSFLNGNYSLHGWWYFFPYTLMVKTPLPFFALLALALAGAMRNWWSIKAASAITVLRTLGRGLYATAPLWVFLAVYWAQALSTKLNIGHRHILPTYPAMFILAGAAAHWFKGRGRTVAAVRAAVIATLAGVVIESFWIYPDYLAYFNQIVGGPANGYKHLVDSSLDWGQDLPGLKTWLDRNNPRGPGEVPAFQSYFGTGSPSYYGIQAQQLPGAWERRAFAQLTGGIYCISATQIQCLYAKAMGPWTKEYEQDYQRVRGEARQFEQALGDPLALEALLRSRGPEYWKQLLGFYDELRLARLCAYLRHRRPDDNVGYSILIFRLGDQEVRDALEGPPAELQPSPYPEFRNAGRKG